MSNHVFRVNNSVFSERGPPWFLGLWARTYPVRPRSRPTPVRFSAVEDLQLCCRKNERRKKISPCRRFGRKRLRNVTSSTQAKSVSVAAAFMSAAARRWRRVVLAQRCWCAFPSPVVPVGTARRFAARAALCDGRAAAIPLIYPAADATRRRRRRRRRRPRDSSAPSAGGFSAFPLTPLVLVGVFLNFKYFLNAFCFLNAHFNNILEKCFLTAYSYSDGYFLVFSCLTVLAVKTVIIVVYNVRSRVITHSVVWESAAYVCGRGGDGSIHPPTTIRVTCAHCFLLLPSVFTIISTFSFKNSLILRNLKLYFTLNLGGGGKPHQFFVHQTSDFRVLPQICSTVKLKTSKREVDFKDKNMWEWI